MFSRGDLPYGSDLVLGSKSSFTALRADTSRGVFTDSLAGLYIVQDPEPIFNGFCDVSKGVAAIITNWYAALFAIYP